MSTIITCNRCAGQMLSGTDEYGAFLRCPPCGTYFYPKPERDTSTLYLDAIEGQAIEGHKRKYDTYHPDRGCQFSPSCFSCPLEDCIYDYHKVMIKKQTIEKGRHWLNQVVELETRGWARQQAVFQLALDCGVVPRTVWRCISKALAAGHIADASAQRGKS